MAGPNDDDVVARFQRLSRRQSGPNLLQRTWVLTRNSIRTLFVNGSDQHWKGALNDEGIIFDIILLSLRNASVWRKPYLRHLLGHQL